MPEGARGQRPARDREPGRRVVVTGWGMVTSLGAGVDRTFARMRAGHSGVARLTRFDPTGLPCDIAAQVDDAHLAPPEDGDHPGGSSWRQLKPALDQALATADPAAIGDKARIAVILGGHGYTPPAAQAETILRHVGADLRVALDEFAADPAYGRDQFPLRLPDTLPAVAARYVGAEGPSLPIVSACAAGTQALGEAARLLRDGRADQVVTGGVEPLLTWSYYLGFALLGALARKYASPETASRPFDKKRSGFVIAEGAGALVLETLAGARARGRTILGEILGYGDSSDAFRITEVHPEGIGAHRAMQRAVRDAGLTPEDIEYVNAHGTSTAINDPVETKAVKRLLGDRAYEVPVSSNKSMIGHTIGAAGAIEAILTMRGMQENVILPTINQEFRDRKCDLDYVPNEARTVEHHTALSNSFGFGGQNGCVCLGSARGLA